MISETDMTARLEYLRAAIRLVETGRKHIKPDETVERLVLNAFEAYPHYAFGVDQLTKIINAKERTNVTPKQVRSACGLLRGIGVLVWRRVAPEGMVYELNLEGR